VNADINNFPPILGNSTHQNPPVSTQENKRYIQSNEMSRGPTVQVCRDICIYVSVYRCIYMYVNICFYVYICVSRYV
jgi:hypothetical protein